MLNHIVIIGRLTRDPELRKTQSGTSVASFTLAVDRDFAAQGAEKETDFVDIVAWRNTAVEVHSGVRRQVFPQGEACRPDRFDPGPEVEGQGREQAPVCRGRSKPCLLRRRKEIFGAEGPGKPRRVYDDGRRFGLAVLRRAKEDEI